LTTSVRIHWSQRRENKTVARPNSLVSYKSQQVPSLSSAALCRNTSCFSIFYCFQHSGQVVI
jgi:hypothetical protein